MVLTFTMFVTNLSRPFKRSTPSHALWALRAIVLKRPDGNQQKCLLHKNDFAAESIKKNFYQACHQFCFSLMDSWSHSFYSQTTQAIHCSVYDPKSVTEWSSLVYIIILVSLEKMTCCCSLCYIMMQKLSQML